MQTVSRRITSILNKQEWIICGLAFAYALYWQAITPIQYCVDTNSYYNLARMLLGEDSNGMPFIYRPLGYPLLLALTGTTLGTFKVIVFVQGFFAIGTPLCIYRIMAPDGTRMAMAAAVLAIASGVTTVHVPQIMTEQLYMFLLFLGLAFLVKLVRNPEKSSRSIYWFTITFAALNTVRPIAGPLFWGVMVVMVMVWRSAGILPRLWKKAVGAAILFIGLMTSYIIVDDVFFADGVRSAPSNLQKMPKDTKLEKYLYDLPFNEAYYEIWARRIKSPEGDPRRFNALEDRPALARIREIVRTYTNNHLNEIVDKSKPYTSSPLFVRFSDRPDVLVDQMFAAPNFMYGNYIVAALEKILSKEERLKLFYEAGKEAKRTWPERWLHISPLAFLMGPAHGKGMMKFALALGPLRGFWGDMSAVHPRNGPATRFMLRTFTDILHNHPEYWQNYHDPFIRQFFPNPDLLLHKILETPLWDCTWFMTIILWQEMGYDNASELMEQVADEAFSNNLEATVMRMWNTTLMVAAGPGVVHFDTNIASVARINPYPYLEDDTLEESHICELRATKERYNAYYQSWHEPTYVLFQIFYFAKPFFFLTSLLALVILWARRRPLIVPMLLMVPYFASVATYGMLVTALPRYTNPTILIPVMVTFLAIPTCMEIFRERRKKKQNG